MALRTVDVPPELDDVFGEAERAVETYFKLRRHTPDQGTIDVGGERYVLIRAASLSVDFHHLVLRLFGEGRKAEAEAFCQGLLFDLAHALGRNDAGALQDRLPLADPMSRLATGPIHFAFTGWAHVRILPGSSLTSDDDYVVFYEHPYSFEADAWLAANEPRADPACIMSAGYSAGWCEASVGRRLVAAELQCRARGDEACRFLMAPPSRIEARVAEARQRLGGPLTQSIPTSYENIFARKRLEEELRNHRDELERRVRERTQELEDSNRRLLAEVAERHRAEAMLAQKHKLEALGRLAGGIAHDFNNLLGVIMGNNSMLQSRLAPEDPLGRHAREVTDACARAASLTRQLLAFSRGQRLIREPIDLNAIAEQLTGMLDRLVGDEIELRLELDTNAPYVLMDRGQLEQVLINLVMNARDAMPTGGTIRLSTALVRATKVEASETSQPKDYGVVSVADDGTGMDEQTRHRVFDPFFTTKAEGDGTGLGLSTVYGVVEQSGGHVVVDSALGTGTTFRVFIPLAMS